MNRVTHIHAGQRGTRTVFVALVGKTADAWGPVEAQPLGIPASWCDLSAGPSVKERQSLRAGGIWAFVVAESGHQIRGRYPELFNFDRMPAWITPGVIQRFARYDLRRRPAGPLRLSIESAPRRRQRNRGWSCG